MKGLFIIQVLFVTGMYFTANTYSQDRVVHGIVTTFDSISLVNAQVKVMSSKLTVFTDTLGSFSVICNSKDKLKVSASGFYTQKVTLSDKIKFAAINLKLKPGEKNFDHAIGYGHISEKDKMYAVESLHTEEMHETHQYTDIYDMIKGRFAGVHVENNEIIIRGTNTLMGSSSALIVVDGVPSNSNTLRSISPSQVKTINVIKDGGAAIYGSRGANGVVIIETKK